MDGGIEGDPVFAADVGVLEVRPDPGREIDGQAAAVAAGQAGADVFIADFTAAREPALEQGKALG